VRVAVDFRSGSKEQYAKFCKKYPHIKLSLIEWKNILYGFNDAFKTYILETGEKAKLPGGFGEFTINKKRRKRTKDKINPKTGQPYMNMPINWIKTKEKGRYIYDFNYHTEGFSFYWLWFKKSTRIPQATMWRFKPSRVTSRLLAHYLKADKKYQHLYMSWKP